MNGEEQRRSLAESLLSLVGPKEAEASPIGKIMRGGAKALRKELPSRTSEILEGTEFMGGTIKRITKGRGNWRHIVMADDKVYPVTKDVISDMVRHRESGRYVERLGPKRPVRIAPGLTIGAEGQIDQALKSLAYHEARMNPYIPRKTIRENYKAYVKQVKEAGLGDAVPYSLVSRGGKTFSMPSAYATLLEKEGHLKVIEELR